jgi:hypothetical protein
VATHREAALGFQGRGQVKPVAVRAVNVHVALSTRHTGKSGPVLLVEVVPRNQVALGTEVEVWWFIGLAQHPWQKGTMGIVAIGAATLLCGIIYCRLVLIRERSLKLLVATYTSGVHTTIGKQS